MVKRNHLKRDILIIATSVTAAVVLVRFGGLGDILTRTQETKLIGSLIAGFFFTSAFTIAPAAVALAEISQTTSLFAVALWGAFGAVLGDLLLFLFIRDSVSDDIRYALRGPKYKKIFHIFRLHRLRWLMPILGGLIIASPLPDELGLAVMGFSRMRAAILIPISFVMNFIGVVIVGLVARSLLG